MTLPSGADGVSPAPAAAHWRRLQQLYVGALGIADETERSAYVRSQTADDATLCEVVLELVAVYFPHRSAEPSSELNLWSFEHEDERWSRLQEIFSAAVEIEEEAERAAYIAEKTVGDESLREEVTQLVWIDRSGASRWSDDVMAAAAEDYTQTRIDEFVELFSSDAEARDALLARLGIKNNSEPSASSAEKTLVPTTSREREAPSEAPSSPPAPVPAQRLNSVMQWVLSRPAYQRYVAPHIADMQYEYEIAYQAGARWQARWIVIRGYCQILQPFIKAVVGTLERLQKLMGGG